MIFAIKILGYFVNMNMMMKAEETDTVICCSRDVHRNLLVESNDALLLKVIEMLHVFLNSYIRSWLYDKTDEATPKFYVPHDRRAVAKNQKNWLRSEFRTTFQREVKSRS